MPPKKKSANNKKKGKHKGGGGGGPKKPAATNIPPTDTSITDDVQDLSLTSSKPTISIECANSFASLFAADYPPQTTVRLYIRNELSKKEGNLADRAYEDCSAHFNRGITQFHNMPPDPGPENSRWHIAQGAFLDALEAAMRYPGVFLKTTGMDHRNLLCKVCLSLGQCRGKLLDSKGSMAWSRAAIAADPQYSNGYSQLSIGLQHEQKYEEALENCQKALKGEGEIMPTIPMRIERLKPIVNSKPNSKEWKAALRAVLEDKRGPAVRCFQECNMARPKKSCAMCFWPAERRCSKCETVFYCSRNCQVVHFSEHKHNCIATKEEGEGGGDDGEKVTFPKPDYPKDEWIEEQHWDMFRQSARFMGINMIQCAANNCHVGAMKRALMEENDVVKKVNKLQQNEYPIHRAALRNEPNAAVELVGILIKHGACPNVIRCDNMHLLDICRGRAKWIDDPEPSTGNLMYRMPYQLRGNGMLEKVERRESTELVELVTEAIRNHVKCKLCKRQKATRVYADASICGNMTDELLKEQEKERARLGYT
mmetsp:Transcript_21970/g.32539  ORF Transcript_21970/g.32539 Transcript_21970/m.32539 type:complete len:539 (+) Transcript_21970:60-1676(+)